MSSAPLQVMSVVGSLARVSATRTVLAFLSDRLRERGCAIDLVDFLKEPLELFNPETAYHGAAYPKLKERVDRADVFLLGTPDYHGSVSSALKSFLDHFWHEFAGKLFVPLVASHEKGLTVIDQLRTVARQCYAWTLPYGVSFIEKQDVHEGQILTESLRNRLSMLVQDVTVYGELLAHQREKDLAGSNSGFLARLRKEAIP